MGPIADVDASSSDSPTSHASPSSVLSNSHLIGVTHVTHGSSSHTSSLRGSRSPNPLEPPSHDLSVHFSSETLTSSINSLDPRQTRARLLSHHVLDRVDNISQFRFGPTVTDISDDVIAVVFADQVYLQKHEIFSKSNLQERDVRPRRLKVSERDVSSSVAPPAPGIIEFGCCDFVEMGAEIGGILGVGATDSSVHLWNVRDCSKDGFFDCRTISTRLMCAEGGGPKEDSSGICSIGFGRGMWTGKLLTGSMSSVAHVWDVSDRLGERLGEMRGHRGPVTSIRTKPNGRQIATGSDDGMIRLWDPRMSFAEVGIIDNLGKVYALTWSAACDGNVLISTGRTAVRLHDVRSVSSPLSGWDTTTERLYGLGDIGGKQLVLSSWGRKYQRWSHRGNKLLDEKPLEGRSYSLFSRPLQSSSLKAGRPTPILVPINPMVSPKDFAAITYDSSDEDEPENLATAPASHSPASASIPEAVIPGSPTFERRPPSPVVRKGMEFRLDPRTVCIVLPRTLGRGGFGIVKLGILQIQKDDGGVDEIEVAVKRRLADRVEFPIIRKEVQMMCELMENSGHKNVLRCFGCHFDENLEIFSIVLEFCEGGNIRDWLLQKRSDGLCTDSLLLSCLLQIALGMRHLESLKIVHHDLKPENVLIHQGVAKICDFGFSKHEGSIASSRIAGTVGYIPDPRMGSGAISRSKFDVYSFGIMCWELWTGKMSYEDLRQELDDVSLLSRIHRDGLRPDLDLCLNMPPELADLTRNCWHLDPFQRPTFSEIAAVLDGCHL